ncbi:hypothetical protein GPECTOR_43g921 [Gonium pectorale]|uniref:RanBP-type and C3HC4-type zinc finger-containing protein 1 n=1 Tax=Gonium pectorale TaxID=33097 RepID=A0A150GA90_GONPE|nr:hypothetical protein GPECTOR_43g921 [Gonium pectorale]|eukprot:KXZ46485.1 hypothetical protein GPECTOR_43g921 [Gonium pectorale]
MRREFVPRAQECHICKDDVPASVSLRPCGHMICFACVENLRAKNIFRADKGVKCPFCRTYVTQYEPCNSADPEQVRLLNEANRAAAFAHAGRAPSAGSGAAAAAAAAGAAAGAPAEESWMCGSCRCLNLSHREECSSCGRPNPRPKQQVAAGRSKDVLRCSDEEVLAFLQERHQPNLQRCFTEVGIGFSMGRCLADAETPRRIVNAFKQRGEERMLRLIKLLGDPEVFNEVATHFLANYALQSLVEATLQIRKALELAAAEGQYPLESFREAHGGRDPHGLLLYAALPHAPELAVHERANYLLQKLADHAGPQELVDLCRAVFPQGPNLARDNKGVFVMLKLLTKLKEVCTDGAHRFDACELADGLCCALMEAPDRLKFCLHNTLASKVLAAALSLGLPQYGALQLGSRVCSAAAQLAASKNGISCVLALLDMESSDAMCSEYVRDLYAVIAMQLQGGLVGLLLRRTADDRGPAIVRLLLRRLAAEQEIGWLDAICQELVNYGDLISESSEALEVLKELLCYPVLDDDTVLEHLLQLRQGLLCAPGLLY